MLQTGLATSWMIVGAFKSKYIALKGEKYNWIYGHLFMRKDGSLATLTGETTS